MMGKNQLFVVVSSFLLLGLVTNIKAQGPILSLFSKNHGNLPTPEEGCGFSNIANTKIVGGSEAKSGAYPWMALLGYPKAFEFTNFECGGSLITSRHVLTSARCVDRKVSFVRLGEHNLFVDTGDEERDDIKDMKVVRVEKHPKFDEQTLSYDIAILTLEHDVEFNDRIQPICLPFTKELQSNSFVDTNPFVAGWGRLKEKGPASNVLMQAQIPVIENEKCKELYQTRLPFVPKNFFDDKVVCAGHLDGGEDSCDGDIGGPLMLPIQVNGTFPMYQIGVVSSGFGCGQKNSPGIYTRVSHFIDWIKTQVII